MAARSLFGPTSSRKRRRSAKPKPQTPRQRLIGPVSRAVAPKRKLPAAIGSGPEAELSRLFDGAADPARRQRQKIAASHAVGDEVDFIEEE